MGDTRQLPDAMEAYRTGGEQGLMAWYRSLTPEQADDLRLEMLEIREKLIAVVESVALIMSDLVPVMQTFADTIARAFEKAGMNFTDLIDRGQGE